MQASEVKKRKYHRAGWETARVLYGHCRREKSQRKEDFQRCRPENILKSTPQAFNERTLARLIKKGQGNKTKNVSRNKRGNAKKKKSLRRGEGKIFESEKILVEKTSREEIPTQRETLPASCRGGGKNTQPKKTALAKGRKEGTLADLLGN